MNRRDVLIGIGAGFASAPGLVGAQTDSSLKGAARDAWLFVLPLVLEASLRARPNTGTGDANEMNVLRHSRMLANPSSRVVTTPNNDTLYSTAFIDTTQGPVQVEVPEARGRYLSVQIMDAYTNDNFILSPRTPGGAAGSWRLISPDATLRDARDLRLATPHAWLLVRILVDGPRDLPAVHTLQDDFVLKAPATPMPPLSVDSRVGWPAYFATAQRLLAVDPPRFTRGLDAFAKLRDACSTRDFSRTGYAASDAAAIDAGVDEAAAVARSARESGRFVNGWTYPRANLGEFGDEFIFRAIVAVSGIGALTPAEAIYMRSAGDGKGLFNGDGLYRLKLSGPIPVDAFWSLTMYEANEDGRFFLTPNPLNRYSIGDRTQGLVRGSDGSLDIWISRSDPKGSRTANWLPAPSSGPFATILRAYLPRAELLKGEYRLPPIVSV